VCAGDMLCAVNVNIDMFPYRTYYVRCRTFYANSVPNMSANLSMKPTLADIICTLANITCYYGQHIMFVIDILCLFVVLNRT